MARGRRIIEDSSDDELPDIHQVGSSRSKGSKDAPPPAKQAEMLPSKGVVKRRRLRPKSDNALLRPAVGKGSSGTIFDEDDDTRRERSTKPRHVELRPRKTSPVFIEVEDLSEAESVREVTIIEDFSGDDESDFEAGQSSDSEGDDSIAGLFLGQSPPRSFMRPGGKSKARKVSGAEDRCPSPSPSVQLLAEAAEAQERDDTQESSDSSKGIKSQSKGAFKKADGSRKPISTDLDDPFSDFELYEDQPPRSRPHSSDAKRPTTPTPSAPEPRYKGLASPSKQVTRIPATPHRPHMDTFWDQEFVDEWNEEHSPEKQLFPPPPPAPPAKKSPVKKGPSQAAVAKTAKKAFEQSKHELAASFLRELDERITGGHISELSASTGGVRLEWTNRLNTTAGRAKWRRETTKREHVEPGSCLLLAHKHYASIELAEKVIDDEHRLLNVVAHEFCHLANFMLSGVRNNPHGKDFKAWAAKVTRAFGDRGIEVTTMHSFDIDFKYVWECTACGQEFKRHSKSINPESHRCGVCKSKLRQTRPVPRGKPGGESEYQRFMKEQMRAIKLENPGCPQKDIMKLVASRWSKKEKGNQKEKEPGGSGDKERSSAPSSCPSSQASTAGSKQAEAVSQRLSNLTLIDLT